MGLMRRRAKDMTDRQIVEMYTLHLVDWSKDNGYPDGLYSCTPEDMPRWTRDRMAVDGISMDYEYVSRVVGDMLG